MSKELHVKAWNDIIFKLYTYTWTLDHGLFSACTYKSEALRKKLRARIMTSNHIETQCERTKTTPALTETTQTWCHVKTSQICFLLFRLRFWFTNQNLRARGSRYIIYNIYILYIIYIYI